MHEFSLLLGSIVNKMDLQFNVDNFRRVASQFFLVSPRANFVCPVPSFSEMKEIG